MSITVLWPRAFARDGFEAEIEGLGEGLEGVFVRGIENVTDEQWEAAEGLVGGPLPLEYAEKAKNARIYVKSAVGFDDVDVEGFGKLGIPVCNTPDYGTREVADHAMALMMTLTKSIAFHNERLRAEPVKNWQPALNPFGQRLATQTFGIVGMGRIGTAAALRAKAFDKYAVGVRRADSLEELMGQSDIVSIHAPLNADTRGLIGKDAFAAAKKGMIVVNTARGPVIDLDALHDAMKNDTVLAAGLDVLPDEPANVNAPLIAAWHRDEEWIQHRLLVTPHSAFFTPQSMRDIRAFSARTAARYLRDGRLESCVNEQFLTNRR
jgi:lactate dehydrogenase-like 2-hydroxyacid dehydrogenase